jgi:hypothetical protein
MAEISMAKKYSAQVFNRLVDTCLQVHGGMGFIEDTGAAQLFRDARILAIYEGTTAIQANDLVGRKTLRDGGATARGIAQQIALTEAALAASSSDAATAMRKRLQAARTAFTEVVDFVVARTREQPASVFAGSVPYLMLAGRLLAGWQMARSLLVAEEQLAKGQGDAEFLRAKINTARFFAEHILVTAPGTRDAILDGANSVNGMAVDSF